MATRVPTFLSDDDIDELVEPLRTLAHRLEELAFEETARLPIAGGRIDTAMEPANLWSFLRGQPNLFHPSAAPWAYRRLLARQHPEAVELHEFLTLCRPLAAHLVEALLGRDLVDRLLGLGVLERVGMALRSNVLVVGIAGGTYFSDPPHLHEHPDYAYTGRSTFTAPLLMMRLPVATRRSTGHPRRVLDLGCGSGIGAAMAGVAGFEQVVGTDVVERCLRFGRLNAAVNGLTDADFHLSDVFDDVEGTFDVVISNTPCVWEELQQATFVTGGGDFGTALPVRMLRGAIDHLRPGGTVIGVVLAPCIGDRPEVTAAIERAIGDRTVHARITPMFAEYEREWAPVCRRHGISRFERYVVTITQSDRPRVTLEPGRGLRYHCSRVRVALVRALAERASAT